MTETLTKAASLTKTIVFDAKPETVWRFLTEAEKLAIWYHRAEADLAPGAPYTLLEDGKPIVTGRVLAWEPHERLVTTFCIGPFGDRETRLTWQLAPLESGTRLTLTHEGIAEAALERTMPMMMALDRGWDSHFAKLRTATEA